MVREHDQKRGKKRQRTNCTALGGVRVDEENEEENKKQKIQQQQQQQQKVRAIVVCVK